MIIGGTSGLTSKNKIPSARELSMYSDAFPYIDIIYNHWEKLFRFIRIITISYVTLSVLPTIGTTLN